jgi:hypothetical protein
MKPKKKTQPEPQNDVEIITQEQAVLRALAFQEARLVRIEAKLDAALASKEE